MCDEDRAPADRPSGGIQGVEMAKRGGAGGYDPPQIILLALGVAAGPCAAILYLLGVHFGGRIVLQALAGAFGGALVAVAFVSLVVLFASSVVALLHERMTSTSRILCVTLLVASPWLCVAAAREILSVLHDVSCFSFYFTVCGAIVAIVAVFVAMALGTDLDLAFLLANIGPGRRARYEVECFLHLKRPGAGLSFEMSDRLHRLDCLHREFRVNARGIDMAEEAVSELGERLSDKFGGDSLSDGRLAYVLSIYRQGGRERISEFPTFGDYKERILAECASFHSGDGEEAG